MLAWVTSGTLLASSELLNTPYYALYREPDSRLTATSNCPHSVEFHSRPRTQVIDLTLGQPIASTSDAYYHLFQWTVLEEVFPEPHPSKGSKH